MCTQWVEQWRRETPRFVILGETAPEEMEWDGDGPGPADSDAWFQARIRVCLKDDDGEPGAEMGADYLGGCWYESEAAFFRHSGWATTGRKARDEARRVLAHVGYLNRYRPGYRAQIARELAKAADLRRQAQECRQHARSGAICCEYFPSMVREALRQARATIARIAP